jgi:hypothetical protein
MTMQSARLFRHQFRYSIVKTDLRANSAISSRPFKLALRQDWLHGLSRKKSLDDLLTGKNTASEGTLVRYNAYERKAGPRTGLFHFAQIATKQ